MEFPNVRNEEFKLQEQLKKEIAYVFYKKDYEEFTNETYYKCYCTACKEHFALDFKKTKISTMRKCPKCQNKVIVKIYKQREYKNATRTLNQKFMYIHYEILNQKLYAFTYKCEYDFSGDVGEEHIRFYKWHKYEFDIGLAKKYEFRSIYRKGNWQDEWVECKQVTQNQYYPGFYGQATPYPTFYKFVDIKKTTLKYFPLILSELNHELEWLAFYAKNPCIEYLVKTGAYGWCLDYMNGWKAEFRKVINTKAKDFKKMIKLSKQEYAYFKTNRIEHVARYISLKKDKILKNINNNTDDFIFNLDVDRVAKLKSVNADLSKFEKYITKQSQKQLQSIRYAVNDYFDYISMCKKLNLVEFKVYPSDLKEQHDRLAARIRELKKIEEAKQTVLEKAIYHRRKKELWWTNFTANGWTVRPIDSLRDLIIEGEQNDNCVADYGEKICDGRTSILVIRDKSNIRKSLYTVELDHKTNTVRQCRGFNNKRLDDETEAKKDVFIEKWEKHLKRKNPTTNKNQKAG